MQLWLVAGAIAVLAVLVAVAITDLRRGADRARRVQLIAAELNADAQHISRLEWQATAGRRLDPGPAREFHRVVPDIERLAGEYRRADPEGSARLEGETRPYLAGVEKQLALLGAGRVAESRDLDARVVDPSFQRLQRRLRTIVVAEDKEADRAAARTDLGVTGSLLLSALALIAMLWRLDAIRSAAARIRHRDLQVQALQDALTGLPNRRKLQLDLEQAVQRAGAGDGCLLILCDLDGFKAYNDTFGHLEGDLLLVRLSEKLARAVAPHGTAYRLGGDEFCALLDIPRDELEPALTACHTALSESGTGFDVRASIGAVALPEEASTSSAALRLADQRMYAHKNQRGSSVKRQLRDLILRVLSEQDPKLYEHVHDVARLAAGVGRRLGVSGAQAEELVRAAELHDVGKVAIPDSILHKPGPLVAREWDFVRRHTLIGESILSAAPALAGVGRLVRSSHERYDGSGYPDGVRGDEIPLSSRIIFVCDAFHAMTTDRSYRQAMNAPDALAELTRSAGTQFDPGVVDAFVTEVAALEPAVAAA